MYLYISMGGKPRCWSIVPHSSCFYWVHIISSSYLSLVLHTVRVAGASTSYSLSFRYKKKHVSPLLQMWTLWHFKQSDTKSFERCWPMVHLTLLFFYLSDAQIRLLFIKCAESEKKTGIILSTFILLLDSYNLSEKDSLMESHCPKIL